MIRSAEPPIGLAAQVGGVFLIYQRHPAPRLDQLVRGDQPGQPRPNDYGVIVHPASPCIAPTSRAAISTIRPLSDGRQQTSLSICIDMAVSSAKLATTAGGPALLSRKYRREET